MIYTKTLPISPVTLDEVKAHLRLDIDEEDELLNSYILAATQDAEHRMCREIIYRRDPFCLCHDINDVPPIVKQYILITVADMYTNRENITEKTVNFRFVHLLDPYILYNRQEDEAEVL